MSIIGHKIQWRFLQEMSQRKRVPQSMIFSGQDSLGKKKVALEFIKFLNCKDADFTLLAPQEGEIHISQIRDLQKSLNFKPQMSSFKSVIIDDAETLNWQAQNCLLKTLEEPKAGTLLILITSRIEVLFETIRSRCQILKFYPVSFEEVLETQKGTELEKIFLFSQGNTGKIINFLNDPQKFSLALESFLQIEKLFASNLFERFCFASNLFKKEISSEELRSFLDVFENYLRLVFLKKIGIKNKILDFFNLQIAESYSIMEIKKAVELIEDLKNLIVKTNLNLKLAFENFLIHCP